MFNEKEYRKKYYLNNKEKIRARSAKCYSEKKDDCLNQMKKYSKKNKELIKKRRRKHYLANKDVILERNINWRKANKEKFVAYQKIYQEENKEKIKEIKKQYRINHREELNALQRKYNLEKPHLKRARNNRYFSKKYATNENFVKMCRLRGLFNQAFKRYSKTGKAYKSKKYGVDFQAICEYLGPCPGDRKKYRIHHIKPLHTFDFDDPEQVKEAFSPENHQWVSIEKHEEIHQSKFV